MKIQYTYSDNGTPRTGFWQGDPDAALEAAIRFLGAAYDHETESYVYEAPETGEIISVSEDEMIKAGAARLSAPGEWYSLWCANTGAPVGR